MFARDIMTRNPVSISPDATLRELITLMTDKTFEAIPVRSNGKVIGIRCPTTSGSWPTSQGRSETWGST